MTSTASHSPHLYVDCDLPEDMTLVEWRRSHTRKVARSRLHRFARRLTYLS